MTGENAGGGSFAVWGRGTRSGFEGRGGALGVDGDVTTLTLGADWADGPWLAGLALSQSRGEGGWRETTDVGKVEASLTGLYPYVGYHVSERLIVWGSGGRGTGELTLATAQESLRTDISMTMAAAGVRGDLVVREGDEGPALAIEADGLLARTASEAFGGMRASQAQVTRLRLALEGSQGMVLGSGTLLTLSVAAGVRHEGGDAETGFGVDIGGGLLLADTSAGLRAEISGRTLLAHEDSDFRDWGVSGSLLFDPDPSSALGPELSLRHARGSASSGGARALFDRATMAGLAEGRAAGSDATLEIEAAYGLAVFGGRYAGAPHAGLALSGGGRVWTVGWRLERAGRGEADIALGIAATRNEPGEGVPPGHRIGGTLSARW